MKLLIIDNMLHVDLQTAHGMARMLAERVKTLRIDRGWTQEELAERAGLRLATYRRFERTGHVSLERLVKLAVVLDARAGFERLFVRSPASSLAELEQQSERQARKRGKRRNAQA